MTCCRSQRGTFRVVCTTSLRSTTSRSAGCGRAKVRSVDDLAGPIRLPHHGAREGTEVIWELGVGLQQLPVA